MHVLSGAYDNTVRFGTPETGQEHPPVLRDISRCTTVAFSPDGRYTASPWMTAVNRVFIFGSLKTARNCAASRATPNNASLAFSPDGRQLLTGSLDNSMRFWDVESGKEVRRFEGHTYWVLSVAFSRPTGAVRSPAAGMGPCASGR